jgi:GNAT superfamily N-acetyltransferase
MKCELLQIDHLPEVITLLSFLNPNVGEEELRKRCDTILSGHGNYELMGAWLDGRLVGVSGLWHGTKLWCGSYLEVDNLVVHPEHQGQGVGTALLRALEALARQRDCNIMVLDSYTNNHGSHRLYHRLGFEIWGFHFIKPLRDFPH